MHKPAGDGFPIHSSLRRASHSTVEGCAVSALCIIDAVPPQLDTESLRMLSELARMVEDEMNRHVLVAELDAAERALSEANAALEERIAERTPALEEKNEAFSGLVRRRNSVQQTLRKRDDRVRNIIADSFNAFISTDAAGMVLEWNASTQRTMRDGRIP